MSSDQSKKVILSNLNSDYTTYLNIFLKIKQNTFPVLLHVVNIFFFFSEPERFIWMNVPLKSVQGFVNVLREAKMSISHILKSFCILSLAGWGNADLALL